MIWIDKVSGLFPKQSLAARALSTISASSTVPFRNNLIALGIGRRTTGTTLTRQQHRWYISRAHPRPIPEYPVPTALQMVLDGVKERKIRRSNKWERNKDKRQSKGVTEVSKVRSKRALLFPFHERKDRSSFLLFVCP